MEARALRFVAPRQVEIHPVDVRRPADGQVLVRSRWSGISGGTELLAYRGELDPHVALDESIGSLGGTFRYPFAYGYACVGEVVTSRVDGIDQGSVIFAFHPHQDLFTVGGDDVVPIGTLEERLATMFPLVETALQVTLDAAPGLGDLVVVQGLGPVGILAATLLSRAGAEVIGVDPRSERRDLGAAFGIRALDDADVRPFVDGVTSGHGAPLVVELTGNPGALVIALDLLAHEGEVLVGSWFGTKEVSLPLGGAFHRRRLTIRSTQVSTIPERLAGRWDVPGRRRAALDLCADLPLKLLATHDVPFDRATEAYDALDRADDGPMHVALRY
jgi:2-desacetyl-2-hydroxyethyl bacteriochlorophyllide A dehydrogenase